MEAFLYAKATSLYMRETISKLCERIEQDHGITILFAIENGSRAWRMASEDSDYDVRFVFVRPASQYIRIRRPEGVIHKAYDGEGNPCHVEGALIDMSGFDVMKFATLLSNSNPTTIEWLMSDIVYYGKQVEGFRRFAMENADPLKLYHHYKSMCRNNYYKYLKAGSFVTYKKYLYAYRGLMNARWVAEKKTIPAIDFNETLTGMEGIIPDMILRKLHDIIALKPQGREKDIIQNIVEMDQYIEAFLRDDSDAPEKGPSADTDRLDRELQRLILG